MTHQEVGAYVTEIHAAILDWCRDRLRGKVRKIKEDSLPANFSKDLRDLAELSRSCSRGSIGSVARAEDRARRLRRARRRSSAMDAESWGICKKIARQRIGEIGQHVRETSTHG